MVLQCGSQVQRSCDKLLNSESRDEGQVSNTPFVHNMCAFIFLFFKCVLSLFLDVNLIYDTPFPPYKSTQIHSNIHFTLAPTHIIRDLKSTLKDSKHVLHYYYIAPNLLAHTILSYIILSASHLYSNPESCSFLDPHLVSLPVSSIILQRANSKVS